MTMEPQRELGDPEITLGTEAFWAAAKDGQLLIGRCGSCGEAYYYPRPLCPFCLSSETRNEPASGYGQIYSYSVPRTGAPYVIALVTLAEGPTIMTNIVDCDLAALAVGKPVRLTFRASQNGHPVPVFGLAS